MNNVRYITFVCYFKSKNDKKYIKKDKKYFFINVLTFIFLNRIIFF